MTRKRMIAAALTAILLPALAACGCSKKAPAGKQAASRDDGQIVALQNQSRYKSRVELRDALASQVICPQHNIDLLTDQKLNPDCGMRRQIIILVDRMIDTGWSLEEIEDALSLIRQGQSLMTVMRNEKSCAPMGGAKIDIFLMSHCPYGLRYTQEILPKMVRDFGESLAFVPHFIVDFSADGSVNALHGQPEVDENKYQTCILHNLGNQKWLEYASCYATEISSIQSEAAGKQVDMSAVFNSARRACVLKNRINAAEIDACSKTKAFEYLRQDTELVKRWDTAASPSAVFNCSIKFLGGAMPYEQAKPIICAALKGDNTPKACEK